MSYVLTVDQIDSRRQGDLVEAVLDELAVIEVVLPFTRTVGDEFQGLLAEPLSVVAAILILMRGEQWHVGLGIGGVQQPLPDDPRSARGEAFLCARTAVEEAKQQPSHLRVIAAPVAAAEAADVESVFGLVAAVRRRRTNQGWQAVDLARTVHTQAEVAERLGISRQAVSQRLQAADWSAEEAALPTLGRLLQRADRAATGVR